MNSSAAALSSTASPSPSSSMLPSVVVVEQGMKEKMTADVITQLKDLKEKCFSEDIKATTDTKGMNNTDDTEKNLQDELYADRFLFMMLKNEEFYRDNMLFLQILGVPDIEQVHPHCCASAHQQAVRVKDVGITLPLGTGATPAKRIDVCPGKNQGLLEFQQELRIMIKEGSRFTSKVLGDKTIFTLGHVGTPIRENSLKIKVSGNTAYLAKNDPIGVIQKTHVAQDFFLEVGTEIVLPAGTIFHIGEEEMMYTKPTNVILI